ncbi:MAG: AAA family ATPase [Pseudomonadota bacterium]
MEEQVLRRVTEFYFSSRDFNGYPVYTLISEFALNEAEVTTLLRDMIYAEKIEVVFGNVHPNAHIKAFSGTPKEQQLEWLDSLDLSGHFCLYPTVQTINASGNVPDLTGSPYTAQLAMGAGQLDYRVFDLSVLEHYRNDPRYYYRTDFVSGQISIKDEYFESDSVPERDQVLLQTFGFSYDDEFNRAVAVFLRYLTDLSPAHQTAWQAKQLDGNYALHPDYYRTSILGEWGMKLSIFDAFRQELKVVNAMSETIGKPGLFRNSFQDDRPRGFGFLLRPTLDEFNDFVLLLDQMMSDNLNKKFFTPEVELNEDISQEDGKVEVRQKGTIALLDEWMNRMFRPKDPSALDNMLATFRKVRTLRQKPAHSPQEDKFDQKYFHEQRKLVMDAYDAVRVIRLVLANHPAVRRNPPEISELLLKGEVWTY